jgi:hypothetical protein
VLLSKHLMQISVVAFALIVVASAGADEKKLRSCAGIELSLRAGKTRYATTEAVDLQILMINRGETECLVGPVWTPLSGGVSGYKLQIRNLSDGSIIGESSFSHAYGYGLKDLPTEKLVPTLWSPLGAGEVRGIVQDLPPGQLPKGNYEIQAIVWDSTPSQLNPKQIEELNAKKIHALQTILRSDIVTITVE